MENSTPIKTQPNEAFSYESINDALYNRHSELSGYWTSLGWDDEKATITYDLEDGNEYEAYVYIDGTVDVPDTVIKEMDEIAAA